MADREAALVSLLPIKPFTVEKALIRRFGI
jgi:hypothetical protein